MEPIQDRKAEVYKILEQCYDPEIPNLSVLDLGLIYEVNVQEKNVNIKMTLTTPGCGLAGWITHQVKMMVQDLPWVKSSNVEIVWDPPWHPNRMSEKAKKMLGFDT